LNGGTAPDPGTVTSGCFAAIGLAAANREELQTILLEPYPTPWSVCSRIPCIDAIFGPTQPGLYWSATTYAGLPDLAWVTTFSGLWAPGDPVYVGFLPKTTVLAARAVRGGSCS
jgi:hypothetical protein